MHAVRRPHPLQALAQRSMQRDAAQSGRRSQWHEQGLQQLQANFKKCAPAQRRHAADAAARLDAVLQLRDGCAGRVDSVRARLASADAALREVQARARQLALENEAAENRYRCLLHAKQWSGFSY